MFDTTTYVEEEYEEEQDYGEGEGEEYEGGGETVTRTRQVRKEVEAHEFGPLEIHKKNGKQTQVPVLICAS